jgi:hypothetical protein
MPGVSVRDVEVGSNCSRSAPKVFEEVVLNILIGQQVHLSLCCFLEATGQTANVYLLLYPKILHLCGNCDNILTL